MTREMIDSIIANAKDEEIIGAWNHYCEECAGFDDMVYDNDSDTYEMMFGDIADALRAASYGDFTFTDTYCCLNAYGNLDTFNYVTSNNSPIDTEAMADWFEENEGELEDWFGFDPDDYEEYDDDEEDDYGDDDDNEKDDED